MKQKLTSAALALPPSILPPPRKEDIISAMVERARVKHAEESQKLEDIRAKAEEKLNSAVKQNLETHPTNFVSRVHNYNHPEVTFEMVTVPPNITKLKEELRNCARMKGFDAAHVRTEIRAGMNLSGDRVKALLDNPEAVKKLDAALEAITK